MLRSADFPRDSCSKVRSSISDALANELKVLWKEGGFASKSVELGVANQKIVVRTMEFPQIDEKELRAAIEFQAQEHIPIPVDEAILDYKVLSTHAADDGSIKQRILLVAAQREMVRQFVNVAKKAGLVISGIDLQAFAMIRALAPKPSFIDQGAPNGNGAEVIALVNMGGGITNLVIAAGGVTQFTRVINLGAESPHAGAHPAPGGLLRRGRGAAHPGRRQRRAARSARRPHARDPGRRSIRPSSRPASRSPTSCAARSTTTTPRSTPGEISRLVAHRRRRSHPQHRLLPFAGRCISPSRSATPCARSARTRPN